MRGTLAALLAATGLVVACTPTPTTIALPTPDPALEAVTDYLDQAVSTERFRGAVELSRDGKVLLRRGYGRANPATTTPNGPNTRFRIASVSKQFTGLAVLVLQERGALGIADRVCAHLPDCPPAWANITIEQLLTHTSGIHNYTDDIQSEAQLQTLVGTREPTPRQLIQLFADRPLDFTPGERWTYSNSGYVLLGHLIELVSGRTYGEFLHDEILDPLGMSNSGYRPGVAGEEYAVGYTDWTTPAEVADDSVWYAAGGMYSTVTDLGRWQRFLLTGDPAVVKRDTLAELLRPRVAQSAIVWYGCGIASTGASRDAIDAYSHEGGVPGFSSYVEIRPASGISVTVVANVNLNAHGFGRTLADLIPAPE